MIFLVDTNIWLELFLEQEKAKEVKEFFETIAAQYLAITEFSVYSIGIILLRLKKDDLFIELLEDLRESNINKVCLDLLDLKNVPEIGHKYNLDFDDSYQYISATKYNYNIVSFDKDFNKTDLTKFSPTQAIKAFQT